MRLQYWAALLALPLSATLNAEIPALDQAERNEQGEIEQIDELALDRDRFERLTIPVTVDGKGPFRFFVDTGAQATVITPQISNALQLPPSGRAQLIAMGSSRVVDTFEIDGLEFANRTVNGLISPLLQRHDIGADGILGLDSLQDLRVLIDFAEDRISVADAAELGGNDGYEIIVRARRKLGQMIITDARIDGVRTAVVIDTGAQNSVGNPALQKKLKAMENATIGAIDVHGVFVESRLGIARSLRIDGLELTNLSIGFNDSPAFAALGYANKPALILGMNNLQMFNRIAIDFPTRRILFDVPGSSIHYQPGGRGSSASRIRS